MAWVSGSCQVELQVCVYSFLTGIGDAPDTSKVRRAFRRQCCLGAGLHRGRGSWSWSQGPSQLCL